MDGAGDPLPKAIKRDLQGNPGPVEFYTYQQIEDFAAKEKEAWAHFPGKMGGGPLFGPAVDQKNLTESFYKAATERSTPNFDERVSQFLGFYESGRLLHSRTLAGQRALSLAGKSSIEAASLVWAFRQWRQESVGKQGENWTDHGAFNGVMSLATGAIARAALSSDTWDPDEVAPRRAALTAIQQDLEDSKGKWNRQLVAADLDYVKFCKKFDELHEKQGGDFKRTLENHEQSLTGYLSEAETRVAKLENVLKEKLLLEAPVHYWSAKVDQHIDAVRNWGLGSFAAILSPILTTAVVVAIVLAYGSWRWFLRFEEHLTTAGLALILLLAVLYFAFARLVVKQYANHVALRDDAAERVVMAQTFLALFQEKKISEAERALVLAPLFRPHGTQVDSDVATGIADALAKLIATQKS